jgi:hypothetical protein
MPVKFQRDSGKISEMRGFDLTITGSRRSWFLNGRIC